MPSQKSFSSSYDVNFNLLLFFLIALTLVGNYWMVVNNIQVGTIYFFMMLGSLGIYVLAYIFTKGDDLSQIAQFMKAPFETSLNIACISYVVGWIAPFLLQLVLNLFGAGFSVTSFSIPL